MTEADAVEMLQGAIWTVLVASGPSVGAAMAVGLIIALFQALTQIQEMTLTFVPKIIAVLVVGMLTASLAGAAIYTFAERVFSRIESGF